MLGHSSLPFLLALPSRHAEQKLTLPGGCERSVALLHGLQERHMPVKAGSSIP